ncbi:hypothetical protein OsI_35615 [Oryza sativa Indica Group]|uniref:Uncharacterized protein n=1 Tax=Oryza sativa subsp. indica TaxID=39946 RepID=B8BJT0_ORYSI|nr:hypothetical protein OsI_35615 [Oryza sativa Indica Group]
MEAPSPSPAKSQQVGSPQPGQRQPASERATESRTGAAADECEPPPTRCRGRRRAHAGEARHRSIRLRPSGVGVDQARHRSPRPEGQPDLATLSPVAVAGADRHGEPHRRATVAVESPTAAQSHRHDLAVPPPSSPRPRRDETEPRMMAPPPPSQRVARLCRRRAPAAAKHGGGRRRGGGG